MCICTKAFLSIRLPMDITLFPCPGYCKQCCNEHWGTHVSFNSGFLSVCAQQWDCWVIWQFYFECYFQFVVEPEVRQVDSSSSNLLSQDCFGYLSFFLYFYTNCEIICSSCVKNTIGSLIGIALNL